MFITAGFPGCLVDESLPNEEVSPVLWIHGNMAQPNEDNTVTIQKLLVSSLATNDALTKLLIEKEPSRGRIFAVDRRRRGGAPELFKPDIPLAVLKREVILP